MERMIPDAADERLCTEGSVQMRCTVCKVSSFLGVLDAWQLVILVIERIHADVAFLACLLK